MLSPDISDDSRRPVPRGRPSADESVEAAASDGDAAGVAVAQSVGNLVRVVGRGLPSDVCCHGAGDIVASPAGPPVGCVPAEPRGDRGDHSRHVGRALLPLLFRLRIHHRERLPVKGPHIVAANHPSYLDPLLVGYAIPGVLRVMTWDGLIADSMSSTAAAPDASAARCIRPTV